MEINLYNLHKIKRPHIGALRRRPFGLLVVAAATLANHAAQARARDWSDDPIQRVAVSYADLDIAHPAGQRILHRRLARAASRACGYAPETRLLDYTLRFERCQRAALARAITDLSGSAVMLAESGHGASGPALR